MNHLTSVITSGEDRRNLSLNALCQGATIKSLLEDCRELDNFRRSCDNLYERVRALFFLYAIHRFHIPRLSKSNSPALIPYAGFKNLLERRFEEAIAVFLTAQAEQGTSASISSALAASYRALGFQTLADQVRKSVRSVRGNQWMFRAGHTYDYPLRLRPELLVGDLAFPILHEATPVRMDFTHSGWSDIFFLGMDFPEGARVLNVSIDLAVRGTSQGSTKPRPPVEAWLRVIDQPVIRLTSGRPARFCRRFFDFRSLRFSPRLPGLAQGGSDCQRHHPPWDRGRHTAPGRSSGTAHRKARPRD